MKRHPTALRIATRLIACLALAHSSIQAATFDVTTTADSGSGSLREAIALANLSPGADLITFTIPGSGEQVIKLASELPAITDTVIIDGYTQPGSSRNSLTDGFDAVINVFIDGAAVPPDKDPLFTDLYGLTLRMGAVGSSVDGVKVANFTHGIVLVNVDSVTVDGSKVLDNRTTQFLVTGNGNAIGRRGAATRNLIAGQANGIVIAGDRNVVKNNYIGFSESINDTPTVNAAMNGVVAYFGKIGVAYNSRAVSEGKDLVCSKNCGLAFQSNHHQIGGLESGEGNVIIGQALGGVMTMGASDGDPRSAMMWVQRNRFGASFDGKRAKGFGNFFGVFLNHRGPSINVIFGNSIFDGVAGVVVEGGKGTPITGARITQNRIVGQSALAIDVGDNNRDVNDSMDSDGGDNNGQNFPVLSGTPNGGGWRLNSAPSEPFTLEFFQSGGSCTNPEADVYLGSFPVTTDAAGDATFTAPLALLPGGFVTATATDKEGNTSELSDCVAAAKLRTKIEITSWYTPVLSGSWSSHFEMRVGGGGLFTPTGGVDLWIEDPSGARQIFGSVPLMNGTKAIWDQLPLVRRPGAYRIQAQYRGDAIFDSSNSNFVDVGVYEVKHAFTSTWASDLLRADFFNNTPVSGSDQILAARDIAAGNTGNWRALGLATGKRLVAAGRIIDGWDRPSFLASDPVGNMTIESLENGALTSTRIMGWQPGTVAEVGRFFNSDKQGVVVERSTKRFEARLLSDSLVSPVSVVRTDTLRNESSNPFITSLSIAAVGDFDGDGNDDIIWDEDGSLKMWLMNGFMRVSSAMPILPPITMVNGSPVTFGIAVVGDFDADGRTDILWRGGDYYYVALMNGGSLKEAVASIPVNTVPAEWKIKVVADYDGDGRADLLWRNEGSTPGVNVIYYMNGSSQPPGNDIVPVQTFLPLTTDFIDP